MTKLLQASGPLKAIDVIVIQKMEGTGLSEFLTLFKLLPLLL